MQFNLHQPLLNIYHVTSFVLAVILISTYIHCKAFVIIWGENPECVVDIPLGPTHILKVLLSGAPYVKIYTVPRQTCLLFLALELQTIPSLLSVKISPVSAPFGKPTL